MNQKSTSSQKSFLNKNNKYDDWICLFCQNHNYSFRQICNRCRLQTKEQNAYMTLLYQQQLEFEQQHKTHILIDQCQSFESQELFPYVVLLMINDDPWEEQPPMRQANKPLNVKWINNLIQE